MTQVLDAPHQKRDTYAHGSIGCIASGGFVFAVVGVWDLDPEHADAQRRALETYIVPGVRQAPGLVKGYWAGEPGTRSHSFILFVDKASAEQFAASVRDNREGQASSGVGVMDLSVVPVSAET